MTEWIVTSSALILIVIALRGLLKGKISLRLQYGLWALVLVRLLIPFSIADSAISIANILSVPTITEADNALADYKDSIDTIRNDYIQRGEMVTNEELREQALQALRDKAQTKLEQEYEQSGTQIQTPEIREEIRHQAQQQVAAISFTAMVTDALPYLWLAGVVLVGAVLIGSNLHFGWKLRRSREELDLPHVPAKVYLTDYVATPCLFGIGKPDIYLTSEVMEDARMRSHVLAHEMSHYRQGDHIWSVLRCLCLVLHWYNPLVWVAAILSKQDAELACDEATIKSLGETERTAYGRTLIGMTCVRRDPRSLMLTATTMLGTKKTLKERILLIARKPQMALYTLVACILVAAVAVGCTFTGAPANPVEPTNSEDRVWEQLNEVVDAVNSAESRHFSHYILAEHPGKVYLENATPVNEGWVYGEDFYLGNTEPSQLYYDGTFYARRSDGTWLVDRYPEDDAYGFDISLPSRNNYTMTWTQTEEYLDVVLQSNSDKYDSSHYRMDLNGKLLWYAQTIQGSVTPGTDAESGPIALYSVYYLHDTDPANVRKKVETSAAEILSTMVEWDGELNTEPTEPMRPVINWDLPDYPQLSYDQYFAQYRYYYYAAAGERPKQQYYWGGWNNGKDKCEVWMKDGKIFAGDSLTGNYVQVGNETFGNTKVTCCDEFWIYCIKDQTELFRIDYKGENRQTLYVDETKKIAPFDITYSHVRDNSVLFFVAAAGEKYGIYRLYLPDMTLDLLYTTEDIPHLYEPYSNFEITWSTKVKEIINDVTEIDYYYNCLTGELLDRPVVGDRSWGNSTWAWWLENIDVQNFQDLLSYENGYWYWRALGVAFDKPEDISLRILFYNGLKVEERENVSDFTDSELAFVKQYAVDYWQDEDAWRGALKFSREDVKNVLTTYFGVTLDKVEIPEEWAYFDETDSYYIIRTDGYGIDNHEVLDVQYGDNGIVQIYWGTNEWIYDTRNDFDGWLIPLENQVNLMVMTLQKKLDGGYIVLSNLPVEPEVPADPVPHITNIRDRSKEENLPVAEALERFFSDVDNNYYFPGIKSQYITVYYSDGTSENIITALQTERATIADLDTFGIKYITNPRE